MQRSAIAKAVPVVNTACAHIGDDFGIEVRVQRDAGAGGNFVVVPHDQLADRLMRMLTLTLRGLERDGMVKRTVFPTVPPRVDYELTPLGCSLRRAVEVLLVWSKDHIGAIAEAQAQFDRTHPPAPA